MFSRFKKNASRNKLTDIIWLSEQCKLQALAKIARENPETIFIAWFDERLETLSQYFIQDGLSTDTIYPAQKLSVHQVRGNQIVFIEHYPLHDKEQAIYQNLALQNVIVHSALDEPFMKTFGSEKIIDLMRKLGAKEEEAIQHTMVSSSIKNAQEKLKQKVSFERTCRSQADWIKYNLPV